MIANPNNKRRRNNEEKHCAHSIKTFIPPHLFTIAMLMLPCNSVWHKFTNCMLCVNQSFYILLSGRCATATPFVYALCKCKQHTIDDDFFHLVWCTRRNVVCVPSSFQQESVKANWKFRHSTNVCLYMCARRVCATNTNALFDGACKREPVKMKAEKLSQPRTVQKLRQSWVIRLSRSA